MSSKTLNSGIIAIVSDIHFPHHDKAVWKAFKKWAAYVKPKRIIILGDFVDLEAISRFGKSPGSTPYVVNELKLFIQEANWLATIAQVDIVFGNHEARFDKKVAEAFGYAANGLLGLTLKDQLYFQGLDNHIKIYEESTKFRGIQIGQFLLRHGDKQAGRVAAKNIASIKLDKSLGDSEIVGHHHAMQYVCRTNGPKIAQAIVNPCMTIDHEYAVGNQWVRGFTILEEVSKDFVTPYPVVIHQGKFAYGGRVYNGNN
jgi:predicted phosphodiesterase